MLTRARVRNPVQVSAILMDSRHFHSHEGELFLRLARVPIPVSQDIEVNTTSWALVDATDVPSIPGQPP